MKGRRLWIFFNWVGFLSHIRDPFIDRMVVMCHFEHMISITIRDLHMKTGDWVRKAAHRDGIVVLDRKQPIARIIPFSEEDAGKSFSERRLVKGFGRMPRLQTNAAQFISEDRDRG
jgi:antitoxin (DNA-binding transcriptional repressor) of toxin-antitoxin stability system